MPSLIEIRSQIAAYPHAYIMGTQKEVRTLPKILDRKEHVLAVTSGMKDNQTWLAVCTQRRLIFLNCRFLFGMRMVQLPLERIQTIDHEHSLMFGSIRVWDGANEFSLGTISKESIKPFIHTTVQAMNNVKQPEVSSNNNGATDNIADQLTKLADLRDRGVLTEEEFQTQKKKLLA